jgi:glycosyltransferase involved in cell wall biosynthesis
VVATLYDLMFELFPDYAEAVRSRPYRIQRWAMRRRARRVIAISETTARDARRLWGLGPDRMDVVALGSRLDAAAGGPAEPPGLPEGALVVLSPYNLEPRKNLARLLHAMAAIRGSVPAARLVLYGRAAVTPEREAAFARSVEELALGPLLVLTGLLDDADLARWYRRADLFVFPSLYEGFGLPVLEAMAAGACVVARDASAMAEVVGDAGVLVDTTDAAALAETLVSLLADPARRRALGERARRRAAGFTVERMARQTLDVYARALHLDRWR